MIKLLGSWNFWFMTWANNSWLKKSYCEINGWFGWFISKLLVASVLLFIGIRFSIWLSFELRHILSQRNSIDFLCDNFNRVKLLYCLFYYKVKLNNIWLNTLCTCFIIYFPLLYGPFSILVNRSIISTEVFFDLYCSILFFICIFFWILMLY